MSAIPFGNSHTGLGSQPPAMSDGQLESKVATAWMCSGCGYTYEVNRFEALLSLCAILQPVPSVDL